MSSDYSNEHPLTPPDAKFLEEHAPNPVNIADAEVMIRVSDVHKSFGDQPVLKGISLEVREHETLGIIGLSGCGKSTLLRIISQLESADTGEVYLGDPHYSLVFQYSALFDSLSVLENVAFSLLEKPDQDPIKCGNSAQEDHERSDIASKTRKKKEKQKKLTMRQIREIVTEKLKMVGLEGIEDQYPNSLSGGMKKRVSFARAIVNNPRIILYDEPTAGLDPVASTMIEEYMVEMRNTLSAASVVVTHQFSTINRCDRLILLHEGTICWEGTPKDLYETDNPYAIQFAKARLEGPLTDDD